MCYEAASCFCRKDVKSTQNEEKCEDEELLLKVKTQLEEMFSDSHLAEDGFLLKHILKNMQGYVSLKLVSSLRKVSLVSYGFSF